jgi:hypothetical protein
MCPKEAFEAYIELEVEVEQPFIVGSVPLLSGFTPASAKPANNKASSDEES